MHSNDLHGAIATAIQTPSAIPAAQATQSLMFRAGLSQALNGDITELAVNKPGEFWTESNGIWARHDAPRLTIQSLNEIAKVISIFNKIKLDIESPIGSFVLPGGERVQILLPPVAQNGTVSITIRKANDARFTLAQYAQSGRLRPTLVKNQKNDELLADLAEKGDFENFFKHAIRTRKNIVIVGSTGSGKTTFAKAVIDLFPPSRRLVTIEDTHELTTPYHPNVVHLFYGPVKAENVLAAAMRMKPDHVFVTELRGHEAWPYLMALQSGHPGSVTSVHANDCMGGLEKIVLYVKQSDVGRSIDYAEIQRVVTSIIDVVCFFENTHLKEVFLTKR
jgi:type IV secretion system protein VirB11